MSDCYQVTLSFKFIDYGWIKRNTRLDLRQPASINDRLGFATVTINGIASDNLQDLRIRLKESTLFIE